MQEPLDQDWTKKEKNNTRLTRHPVRKAIFYLCLMLLGQLGAEYWFTRTWSIYTIRAVLEGVFIPLLISTLLEAFRWWRHRRREALKQAPLPRDPFWFQLIEGAMAIWLLFLVAAAARIFLF